MYIRRVRTADHEDHYLLRISQWEDAGYWGHRDLLDLGDAPGQFVHYPGGNGFYFDPALEEALDGLKIEYTAEDLENAFLPFMRPDIRQVVERFGNDHSRTRRWKRAANEELFELQKPLHSFDKRRLHYLRFGRIDIGNLEGREWKFLNVLLGKCRDEIEYTIALMERALKPRELRTYIYTALELQSYFHGHLLRNHPAALDRERLDAFFLDEICSLNRDRHFFMGSDGAKGRWLHPYLVKYVVLYFDHDFAAEPLDDYLQEYIRRRINMDRAPRMPSVDAADACRVLGISDADYKRMSREELVRIYRRRAKLAHPDGGGDHEAFVAMTEAYECLLLKKR